jgi:large subunit ribosomal protein L29
MPTNKPSGQQPLQFFPLLPMKIKELRDLSNEELSKKRRDLKEEMLNLRVQQQSGQLENPSRIRQVRRTVAKIETVLAGRRQSAAA